MVSCQPEEFKLLLFGPDPGSNITEPELATMYHLLGAAPAEQADSKFAEIFQPNVPVVPQAMPNPGFEQMADSINALLKNQALQVGMSEALRVSIERAHSAATAGRTDWVVRQNAAATDYSQQLAAAMRQQHQLQTNLLGAAREAGIEIIGLSEDDIRAIQRGFTTTDLAERVVEILVQAGADTTITNQAVKAFSTLDARNLPSPVVAADRIAGAESTGTTSAPVQVPSPSQVSAPARAPAQIPR